MANIYDGAFRTILNDCRKLILPVINEIFGETYTGEEEIQFFPNEHFIDQRTKRIKNALRIQISQFLERRQRNTILNVKVAYRTGESQ